MWPSLFSALLANVRIVSGIPTYILHRFTVSGSDCGSSNPAIYLHKAPASGDADQCSCAITKLRVSHISVKLARMLFLNNVLQKVLFLVTMPSYAEIMYVILEKETLCANHPLLNIEKTSDIKTLFHLCRKEVGKWLNNSQYAVSLVLK